MADLKDVFARLKQKRKDAADIKKAFKDSLAHDKHYVEVLEAIQKLTAQKKSMENQAWQQSREDAEKLDLLALDIKSDKQLLSDIALNMYLAGKTVEVVDEFNTRWAPEFSATLKKDAENVERPVEQP